VEGWHDISGVSRKHQRENGKDSRRFQSARGTKGLLKDGVKAGPVIAWLQEDFGLGRGHAMAIVQTLRDVTMPKVSSQERLAQHFVGEKARWRQPFDDLVTTLKTFWPTGERRAN
jgi:hypothetical protein